MKLIETQELTAGQRADEFRVVFGRVKDEVSRVIIGQDEVIDRVLSALMAGGHVLLEGVPGLGKTMLVRSLSEALDLHFSRIQFTPDMMPADIRGTDVLTEVEPGRNELFFQQGPIVSNLVLADEINRATPKTQSALLEAMQEKQITVGNKTIRMEEPYTVMATQNPVEQEGTYPLPEAQLDRFLFKIVLGYPKETDYYRILDLTTGAQKPTISPVCQAQDVKRMQSIVREVEVPDLAKVYAVRLVMATQPESEFAPDIVNTNVELGSSPRGAQGLLLAAKVQALLGGRFAVSCDDIASIALPVLRHRMVLNFRAQANRISDVELVERILEAVPHPHSVPASDGDLPA